MYKVIAHRNENVENVMERKEIIWIKQLWIHLKK